MSIEIIDMTEPSANFSVRNSPVIDHVAIHCSSVQHTAEGIDANFDKPTFKASSNYSVDRTGRKSLHIPEDKRAWTTGGLDANNEPIRVNGISGSDIDHRAITIEVASDGFHPYAITDAAYEGLIELLVDICKRHPAIGRLRWKGDKSLVGQPDKQNIAVHRWFAYKACPGDYIYERLGAIADEVNRRLDERDNEPSKWKGAAEAVNWAKETGIMKGDDKGNLRLRDNITREEMCVMLHRFAGIVGAIHESPVNPSVAEGDSSLYTREPLNGTAGGEEV